DTESVIINQPTPLILNSTKTNVKCYDQNTGEIDLIVAGGIAPYNYQWSNKSTTKDQVNLPAGDYTVTVTDANGCLTTGNITINQPGYPALTVIPITTDIICYGDMTGAISLNVFGGTKPYQFMWSNGMKDQNISGLPAGLFNVTVIDGNGCTTDTSATLIQSPAPIVTSYNKTDAKCYGSYDGSISLNVTGGFTPYFYKWSDGKTSANINSLNSDNYTVTVTDAKGCIRNKTINISQPDSLSLSFKTFDVNCYGDITGNINLDVSGGTAPYNYIWSNGKTSQDINKLSAGYYRVTVTDNNNCIKIGSANIKEPLPLDAFADKKDIKCHGQKTGAIYLTPTGGTSPYYYRWSSNNATSQNLIDVAAGNYTVTITDSKYCNKNKNYSITVPDTMTAMISKTDNKCFGDSTGWAHVSVSGGAGQYKYSWNTIPPDTSDIISNLNSGNYSVTVTDKNNCSVVTSVAIISPQPLVINASGDMKVCSNASTELVAIASGGTAPYGYHWNNRPDNIQKQSIKPTSDTTYTVFAKDANNCLSGTKAINITLYKPIILKLSITSGQNTLCYGTKVDLNANATGGKGNYSYSWSTGAKGNVSTISVFPTSKTLYFVTVTDNCTTPVVDSVLINVYPQTPVSFIPDDFTGCPPLFVRFTNKTEHILSCSWNFGDPQSGKDNFSDSLSASHIYYNHGSYNVTLSVIDSNGCKSSSTIYNLVKVISKPTANFKIEPEEIDMNNPDVHFTDLSNDAFKWLWNFGDNYGKGKGNSSTIQNPAHQYSKAGSYLVHLTVYNGSGCEDTIVKSIKIKEVYKFYIPNSFTPNGDGTNDFFIPVGNAIVTGYFELYIFNRWGQQIFYTNDTNNPWNGRYHGTGEIVQDGVYVWMLILKNKDAAKETHYGNVNLYH
ncbi:MAG: PKD domain-containing protein, partial [Bacteroidota bacterium]|nr:PKD domain-containing protein [Bacteroidota bacterium]